VTVWGSGRPRREFLHVDDLADACVFLMRRWERPDIINVGVGEDVSIAELAEPLEHVTAAVEAALARPGRDALCLCPVDALAARVAGAFPGVRVAGTYCPPFRPSTPAEEDDLAARINASGADVVWVGLSLPAQHRWAATMRSRLDVKLIGVVGAAFEYHTGGVRAAPAWMQAASLEWLYRLVQEPRRLLPRYLRVVPRFVALAGMQMLRGRPRGGG
jgi:exopolysaccharide biosynthesis WecB/TagA/CpsF family protein